MIKDRAYWRTELGDRASQDETVPSEYRRILRLIDSRTHAAVIRGCLRQFPDTLLADWLDELEEIGYVASIRAEITQDLELKTLLKRRRVLGDAPEAQDRERIDGQAAAASSALEQQGVFLSQDRLANRERLDKRPADLDVLIVEDDPDQAALADLRVRMAGYRTRIAGSCRDMVELLEEHGLPNLVLLDVMLPDGSGFDILSGFRHHETSASLPVILLTSLVDPHDIRRGLSLGADGYITKPYSKKILAETISEVLKHA
jgi:CheY-like chemotaxis protein